MLFLDMQNDDHKALIVSFHFFHPNFTIYSKGVFAISCEKFSVTVSLLFGRDDSSAEPLHFH